MQAEALLLIVGLPIIPLIVETNIEPFPGTRTIYSIDFTSSIDASRNHYTGFRLARGPKSKQGE